MNEKDQKLFQSLQSRIKKMENLKLEAARITAKQHQLTGLSEGQQQTLARNEQRIQALMAEIEKIEEQIHAKNTQRQSTKSSAAAAAASTSKGKPRRSAYEHDSDEDEFYDRTKENQRKLQHRKHQLGGISASATTLKTGVVLTAESIQQDIKALEKSLVEIDREYKSAQADSAAKSAPADTTEDDALDSFMAATSEQLQASRLAAIQARKVQAENELARQRQLFSIAMPALPAKEIISSKPIPTPATAPSSKPVPTPASLPSSKDQEPLPPKAVEPEAIVSPTNASQSKPVESVSAEPKQSASKEEPKATQQVKVHSRPIEGESTKPSPSPPRKKSRIVGPSAPPKQAKIGPTATNLGPADELEGGDRVWVPPSNQTGDGRTALNDKYGY